MTELAAQLLALGGTKSYFAVGKLLAEQADETVYRLVEDDLEGPGTLVPTLFRGGSALAERGQTLASHAVLGAVCSACVGRICEDAGSDSADAQKWAGVGDRLLGALPQLGARSIIDAAFRVLAELKTSGALHAALAGYVPMLLDTLGTIGAVEITARDVSAEADDGARVVRTGEELKAYWIDAACACRWHPAAAVRVCALLRELALTAAQVQRAAARMQRQLACVHVTELPALVHQLLLLARRGSKREIVGGVFACFDQLEAQTQTQGRAWRELCDVEGTVMLHVSYSVRQDFELGDALLAHARDERTAVSVFSLACLLSLARVHRFADAVTSLLRTQLLRSIHDRETRAATVWVRAYVLDTDADACALLRAVAARASFGWDQVTQALVQLSLHTIDYTHARRTAFSPAACAGARAACMQTLHTAFAAHAFVRAEVVEQILGRVVFQGDARLLDLLARLFADDLDAVRPFASKITDALDSISVIPAGTVDALFAAVAPLFLDDAQFRASLLLILRKVLFAHGVDARRAALGGLFVLIKSAAGALDAAGTRQHDAQLAVLLETLGLLRRCLTQQPEIRVRAYQQLSALLACPRARRCATLLRTLHAVFHAEFAKYHSDDRSRDSPIKLHMCVSPVTHKVVMPIASFLHCYAQLTTALSELELSELAQTGPDVSAVWVDLCARFARAQIEDYELNPEGDFALDSPEGVRNNNTARLVLGSLDACLEYALASAIRGARDATGNPATAIELFSKLARFGDMLAARCVDERRRRVLAAASELSQMSLRTAAHVLELLLPDPARTDRPDHAMNRAGSDHARFVAHTARAALWAANAAFVRHVLEVALLRVGGRTAAPGAQPVEPPTHDVLRLAYIVFAGVLAQGTRACSAGVADLSKHAQRGSGGSRRTAVHVAADVLAACAHLLSARDALGLLPAAVMRPEPSLFEPPLLEAAPARSAEAAAALIAALRNLAEQLLAQKPVMLKESVSVISTLHVLALHEAQAGFACADAAERARVYRVLNETARWASAMLAAEVPGDPPLLRGLALLLVHTQPFLQPEAAFARPSVRLDSADADALPVHTQVDGMELASLGRLVTSICAASRLLSGSEDDDDDDDAVHADDVEEDEPNLSVFTARTIPPLVAAIATWFRAELQQLDWAAMQLRHTAHMETLHTQPRDLHYSVQCERRICARLHMFARLLEQLVRTRWVSAQCQDHAIRLFHDLHRAFASLTRVKLQLAELPVTDAYIDCLSLICSTLNTPIYAILVAKYSDLVHPSSSSSLMMKPDSSEKPAAKKLKATQNGCKKTIGRATVLRNSSLVSSVVYQIEVTEKYVVQLGVKQKTPLAHYLKRSSARDFRIMRDELAEPMRPTTTDTENDDSMMMAPGSPLGLLDDGDDDGVGQTHQKRPYSEY